MARNILVIDDEASIRQSVAGALSDEGFHVVTAGDAASAFEKFSRELPEVVLLDIWMTSDSGEKQQEGLEILSKIKTTYPDVMVIMMSGHGNIETAVRATKLGAFDFIEKPLSLEKLLVTIQNCLRLKDLSRENKNLRSRVAKAHLMVGESVAISQLKSNIRRVAATNSWVLITGENGTGKELVAQAIHAASLRFERPFVEVNCAAIPEELIESELFGHERGAFTGATQLKRGKFDLANGGTLFLDEIGDMSLKTQAKILRILQEQRFERVGGAQKIEVDVRVLAATNKDLLEAIKQNHFREDLYHRLNVVEFRVPALRDRVEDICRLANHFLTEFSQSINAVKTLSSESLLVFENYRWPGNVRELKNAIERLVIFSDANVIGVEELRMVLPQLFESSGPVSAQMQFAPTGSLRGAKNEFEKDFIQKKLIENDWNISKTALALGIERSHLHKKIKSLGIDEKNVEL